MAIFKKQMHKKSFLWKRLGVDHIFTRFMTFFLVFFSSDIFFAGLYFLRLFWQPRNPRNPKHRTLFPMTFFPKTSDFFFKSFNFQVFFRKLFSGDFLTKILVNIRRQTVLIPLQSSLKSLPSWVTLFQLFTNSCNICGSVNKF